MVKENQVDKIAKGLNGGGAPADANTIDQVRELLFGGARRTIEQQLLDIEKRISGELNDLRADLQDRLAALEARLIDAERDSEVKRVAAFKDIGAAVADLGAAINNLGSRRTGR